MRRPLHFDAGVQQVHVPALEPENLTDAEMAPGGQLNGDTPRFGHGDDEGIDLGDAEHGTLRGTLLAGTFDDARIPQDHLVGDGRRQDPAQKPVCLGARDDVLNGEPGVPQANDARCDLSHGKRAELGNQVSPQQRLVELDGAGSQIGSLA